MKPMKIWWHLLVATFTLIPTLSFAKSEEHFPATSPIGIMGDHTHSADNWMAAYRYSGMTMNGNRSGTQDVTDSQVLSNFMVSPQSMTMQMHMATLMYGITDDLTVMAMASYVDKSMDHITRMGQRFTTDANGAGDSKIGLTYGIFGNKHTEHAHHHGAHTIHSLYLNAGLSIPTGSTDERDNTPAMTNAKLPYPMQLGSGTYDPYLGFTYTGQAGAFNWGVQPQWLFRIGRNDEGYSLGDEYQLNLWGGYQLTPQWQISARLDGKHWSDIDGRDSALNPMMVPTANTDLRGGTRVDALLGIAYQHESWKDHRLAFEVGTPVYQHLDGPQLETDLRFTAGWQFTF